MAYTTDEKSTGLDVLTTLATGDLHIVGDVSDSGRAKAITENNLEITIANSSNFVDTLVANNYFTTELANDTNFVNELTTNTTFQSAVNNFVTVVGGGSSGASSGKPMSFYPKLGASSGNSINGYQDREVVFSANGSDIYLADPTGNSQKRDILADWASATFVRGYALIGSYLYVLLVKHTATTDAKVYRYDASDLSLGGTLMTVSGATLNYASDIRLSSNGTHLFMSSDGGASANSEDIAKFSISGTTLTYVSTTTCITTTASFGGAFSVDTAGNYYSTKDGETQTIYVCDSTGTQTSTQNESFQMSSIMNWGNTLYGYNSIADAWSKLYMPATDDSSGVGSTISVVANEDLTAGTPVGISNLLDDTVAKASYISRTVTTPSSTGIGKAINIGTDKIALLYNKASTSEMWLVIGTLNTSTNTFTFGTEVQVTGAITSVDNNWDITKLDTDVVAITYAETATAAECKLVIATISGTTITLGTPQTAVTAGSNVTGNSICTLATDKGVISYMVQGSQVFSIAFTVSGTVATFGSAVSADANLANGIIRSVKLDTDKFVIAVSNYAQVGTLSGTSITMGSALQVLSSYTTANTDLVQAGTNKFIYKAAPTGGGSKNAVACSVSGTTITAGSQINSGVASGLIYISDTEIYDAAVSSSTPTLKKLTLSGTTLTDIGTVIGLFLGASSLRSPLISIGSYWIGIDLNATTITYYVLGMSNNFIGFAQNSASKGGTVTVLTTGIDSNQTGLIPGSYYQVSQGELTRINTFEFTDQANELDIVKAINSTSIKI